jgi:hypothetical protein
MKGLTKLQCLEAAAFRSATIRESLSELRVTVGNAVLQNFF